MTHETEGVAPSDGANEPDDLEQSVDQYMTSLIQRLHNSRGPEAPSPPSGSPTQPIPAKKAADPTARPTAAPNRSPASGGAGESGPPRPVRPPESASDLSALRQLANEHARQVIQTHAIQQDHRGAAAKLLVGGLAIAVSFALLRIWKLDHPLALAAAATSIMVAVRWSWQFLMLTGSR